MTDVRETSQSDKLNAIATDLAHDKLANARERHRGQAKVKRAALALAFMLAGCGQPGLNDRQQDEASDLATDAATDVISESERIAELEGRVEELEARLDF